MKLYTAKEAPSLKETGINYIRRDIPDLELPEYRGESYEDLVPDTLDIQERALLGINGMTAPTDPDLDYEVYWLVSFYRNPPMMFHQIHDHVQAKFLESVPLLRTITGSDHNSHVDRRWFEVLLHWQEPDGCFYEPVDPKRPWSDTTFFDFYPTTGLGHYAIPIVCSVRMAAAALMHELTGDEGWKESSLRAANGLLKRCLPCEDHLYLPDIVFGPDTPVDVHAPKIVATPNVDVSSSPVVDNAQLACNEGWIGQALVQVYRTLGCEEALDAAGKLLRGSALHSVAFDAGTAEFINSPHFHGHTRVLLGMTEYATETGDAQFWDFIGRGYAWGKTYGEPLVGFFPEWVRAGKRCTCELCGLAEMIALAIKISQAGREDLWDDADRWIRNHFAEGQLTEISWIQRRIERRPGIPEQSPETESPDAVHKVAERHVGAFGGWLSGNEWGNNVMHCCTANATRALYYIWNGTCDYRDDALRVNLLLNRSSPWADIDSHIPYRGQVDVKVKHPLDRCEVRIPAGTRPEDAVYAVDGERRNARWDGRYCAAGPIKPGQTVSVCFPLGTTDELAYLEKVPHTYTLKGTTVIDVDPPGRDGAIYRRERYRQDETRWKKVTRFVPEREFRW